MMLKPYLLLLSSYLAVNWGLLMAKTEHQYTRKAPITYFGLETSLFNDPYYK